ncbi:MAG: hypothetical protein KDA28_12540, partial [Phycisphaerales bacterium]|nr:hypothetical protein [Phycisphaerales bacterium]
MLLVSCLVLLGQPERPLAARLPNLETRLEALRPSNPEAYFDLGEEVAEQIRTPDDYRLANQLFVLAFELSRGTGSEVAPGACLALASISRIETDRRWLLSLASSIDARYADPQWRRPELGEVSEDDAFALAMALGAIRSGDGIDAQRILDRPEIMDLLREYEGLLDAVAINGAPERLLEQARQWPCPECRNERIVRVHRSTPPEYTLCHTCGGDPGPDLTLPELIAHLRL